MLSSNPRARRLRHRSLGVLCVGSDVVAVRTGRRKEWEEVILSQELVV